MNLIPAIGRQTQVDFCEIQARLVFKVSFRIVLLYRETLSRKTRRKREIHSISSVTLENSNKVTLKIQFSLANVCCLSSYIFNIVVGVVMPGPLLIVCMFFHIFGVFIRGKEKEER